MSKKKSKDKAVGSELTSGQAAVEGKIPPQTIAELLVTRAHHSPDAIAIAASAYAPLTYRGLAAHVHDVVESLRSFGVGRCDRVAIALPDGPEMAAAFLATASGAIAAPLNPGLREREFEFYFSDLQPKAVLVQSNTAAAAIAAAQRTGIPTITLSPSLEGEAGRFTLECSGRLSSPSNELCDPDDVALVMYTSGTTSKPKPVPLTHQNLLASARNIRTALDLKSKDRCLNVMPLFHIHGLVGAVLSSMAAGSSVICTAGFDPEQFFAWLKEFQPTWYTAVPTIHQAVLSCAPADHDMVRESSLRFIRSSSAALSPGAMAQLEELFAVPVIEAYGMTEASHQIASNPLPPGKRKPGSVGLAVGTEISVTDERGRHLLLGRIGEIVLRGPNLMEGYENAGKGADDWVGDGWFRTGDLGYLDADGYLFITGRIKEQINRGGEKVSPNEVETVLLEHPAVAEAVVFPLAHASLGEDIAAAVVMKSNCSISEGELQRYAAEKLADFKIPRRVMVIDEIPKGATGKVQRAGLAEALGLATRDNVAVQRDTEFVAPRTETERQLARIWSEVLGVDSIGVHDNFFELGGQSILAAQIMNRVRATMKTELSFIAFFNSPTVAAMAGKLERASEAARALPTSFVRRAPQDGVSLPLSFAQQRMWFLDQLERGSAVYIRPAAFRLLGPLNITVLERTLDEIVRRHEVLRASFPVVDGQPIQVITPSALSTLPVIDISGLPSAKRESRAATWAAAEIRRPFDLARGPLLRAALLRLADEEHVLLLIMHHIAFDGWSANILKREIFALYGFFSTGQGASLRELPIQYAEFARWQREWLQGDTLDTQLAYWKRQLANIPPALDLPTDRPRPSTLTHRGACITLPLSSSLSTSLKALSQREGVTLFMTLLAAFQTLLHRYSGQDDVFVGSPIAGRARVETEELIGFFVNTLVLRTDLSGNPTFRELLGRIREVALGAYAHQDIPFEKLVEELQPKRDLSRTPLFQVMFNYENIPEQPIETQNLRIEEFEVNDGIAAFELTVEIVEKNEKLSCLFKYNTDLFDEATVRRISGHFRTLLEGIVADSAQRLSDLPLLTSAEQHRLLVEWNATQADYPKNWCLHHLFEAQAERTPEAVAIVFEDVQLTYRELNRRANQLAHYLRKLGVNPEVLVGICTERSLEMMIGLLGILKAGAAYLPLDPAYPKERLSVMLTDARAPVLLTQGRLLGILPESPGRVVCMDTDWDTIAHECDGNPASEVTPGNMAYAIYTSGSTGRPKAVMIEHESVVNYLCWVNGSLLDGKIPSLPVVNKPVFDVSLKQLFAPLLRGGEVQVITEEVASQPAAVLQALGTRGAGGLNCVTSLWKAMLDMIESGLDVEPTPNLARLLVGGERLSRELVGRSFAALPHVQMWNLYGPTEATSNSSAARVSPDQEVTIGRPIANTQIHILNAERQPVPVGLPGEIHIGGVGLARGYLNRPDLTAEKFIPNPFSAKPGARLYRTGDLARYLPDGNIEFLGRIDHQVKIRGFRVELGEIEAVLNQHPKLREAVVLAREQGSAGNRLVAYVVSREDRATIGELRAFLRAKLPDYMIPSVFVFLDALPLMPNGKLDRKALPEPDSSRPELENEFVAPRTPAERALAKMWATLLSVERVGVHDNFFELGGHSLLATQLMARIKTLLQTEFPLRTLFENPTIEGLAAMIVETRGETDALQAHTLDLLAELESIFEQEAEEMIGRGSPVKK